MTPCARCRAELEAGDLRCAICALPVADVRTPDMHPPDVRLDLRPADATVRAQVLRCTECGAAVSFAPEAGAPSCGFCGATMAIEQPVDPLEFARLRVPFTVHRAAAEAALRGWLGARSWFAPRALASDAVLASLTPLAWAAWRVNARARVAWTADSDAGAERSAWAPHAGEAELELRDIVVAASRGLRDVEARLLIPHYDLAHAVPIDAPGGDAPGEVPPASDSLDAEMIIERFDAQRSAARRHIQDRIEALARVRIEPRIPGRRYRNVRVACLLERQTTERMALPAWILAYRYRGVAYRAVVHGQRAEIVLGRSPIDWGRVAWLTAVLAALIGLIAALLLLR